MFPPVGDAASGVSTLSARAAQRFKPLDARAGGEAPGYLTPISRMRWEAPSTSDMTHSM